MRLKALTAVVLVLGTAPAFAQNIDFKTMSDEDVLKQMTYEEKAYMVMGHRNNPFRKYVGVGSTWYSERLGIPPVIMDDGPAGLRMKPIRDNDSTRTYYSTAFPTAASLAATWNTSLVERVGVAMGNEVLEYGSDMLLAPAVNIHRNPLCGRNFEYYSEDPLLAGKIGVAMVTGIQSQGVGTSVKHFAANNAESNRKGMNSVISQRALREIYLRPFEIVVKEAHPWAIMSSYNKVNGYYASQNKDLLTTVLRDEWKFDGVVMTDWVCGDDAVAQMRAGNDMIMPGFPTHNARYHHIEIVNALEDKILSEDVLDRNIMRMFDMVRKSPRYRGYEFSEKPDLAGHARIARQAADEAMVLLANKENALPLNKKGQVALFGKTSYDFITGGTGSGEVYYEKAVSLKEGLVEAGFRLSSALDKYYTDFINETLKNTKGRAKYAVTNAAEPVIDNDFIKREAEKSDLAVITIGRLSGEGADRPVDGYFTLSSSERELLENTCREFHANKKKVIVILNIGGVIETASWKDLPDAILLAWQTGQQGGSSVASILTGKVNPSGHLPMSFPVKYSDVPSAEYFPGVPKEKPVNSYYNEGIYVGYRYYTTFGVATSYPFGYGLSYTDFEYSGLELTGNITNGTMKVKVTVKNIGNKAGKDVVQLYISAPSQEIDKPVRELKAFAKTTNLKPGETETVVLDVDMDDLASFYSGVSAWVAESGEYKVEIGASSEDIRCNAIFSLNEKVIVEQLNDVLYPNFPVKDLGTSSVRELGNMTPFGKFHDKDYDFNWRW